MWIKQNCIEDIFSSCNALIKAHLEAKALWNNNILCQIKFLIVSNLKNTMEMIDKRIKDN